MHHSLTKPIPFHLYFEVVSQSPERYQPFLDTNDTSQFFLFLAVLFEKLRFTKNLMSQELKKSCAAWYTVSFNLMRSARCLTGFDASLWVLVAKFTQKTYVARVDPTCIFTRLSLFLVWQWMFLHMFFLSKEIPPVKQEL